MHMNEHDQHPAPPTWSGPGSPPWPPADTDTSPAEPSDDDLEEDEEVEDEDELTPEELEQELARRRRKRRKWTIVFVVVVLLISGLVVFRNWYVKQAGEREQARATEQVDQLATMGSWDEAKKVLDDHAAALLRGDEQGWLAAVDPNQPQLREYYQRIYTAMRAMDVSGWDYFVGSPRPYEQFGTSRMDLSMNVAYCLAVPTCPHDDPRYDPTGRRSSAINQDISLDKVDGQYRIVGVQQGKMRKPARWQTTGLTFAQGERVAVAAPDSQKGRQAEAVAAADQAAVAADRFTGHTGYKPVRYRVYLAGEDEWKAWGEVAGYAAGYAVPTGLLGTDIVVRMSAAPNRETLVRVLQHEMAHAVTLGGTDRAADSVLDTDAWLSEGVAKYIELGPTPEAGRLAELRQAGAIPTDLRLDPLQDDATDKQVATLYGYGHLAVICMADRYGEDKMMRFVNRVLREDATTDQAARDAFGKPFAEVNRTCTAYFRDIVR
jgi:hypothetical protein